MDIFFDENGLIIPNDPIETDMITLEEKLVFNGHRRELYEIYQNYVIDLKTLINEPIEQWINGSFVTLKEKPNDIDTVSFIPYKVFNTIEADLQTLKKAYKPFLDAYHVCDYPETHPYFVRTKTDKAEWLFLYWQVRNSKLHKGFLKINL
jgi:hypothetical protein